MRAPVPPAVPLLTQRLARTAFLGMLAWVGLLFAPLATEPGAAQEAGHLVLLAPLALVPLYLGASVPASFGAPRRSLVVASWALPVGALGAALSLLVPAGAGAGALAGLWVAATLAVAAWAGLEARDRWRSGGLDAAEAALAVGWVTLVGGAVWLGIARSGLGTEYGQLVELLTAAHFHYGGALAVVWTGLLGRTLGPRLRPLLPPLAAGLVVGFWGVAVGIAIGGVPGGGSVVETAGVLLLAASAIGVGVLGVVRAGAFESRATGGMVAVSGGALALAMGLALWFHLGPRLGLEAPGVAWMVERHGWLNAFGFGLWGALGFRRLRPRPRG